ncbi:MAG: FAD-binding oxidoreductase, partial [Thermoguttaceae bacterium]|nr:FAD-binding oxidoreductase [Thermoguttaceae bacterium]
MSESLAASQARLQEDLRGLVRGDVRCDEIVLQLFSSDGGPFQERPTCVVWPRSTADVAAVVQYAAEKKISVHPRGSGSSGGCGAIGSGIILDFSRYMRRLLRAGDDDVVVQPGAIRERVNDGLRSSKRRFFAPSSGHVPVGTIGSILAADAIGPRWLRCGSPNERVLELTVVDAAGKT